MEGEKERGHLIGCLNSQKDVGIHILILVRGSLCFSQNMGNSDFLSLFCPYWLLFVVMVLSLAALYFKFVCVKLPV